MTADTRIARAAFAMLWACTLWACAEEAPPIDLPAMSEVELDDASGNPVSGTIASEDFEAVDVRYRVVERAGRERVDFFFSDRPIERCGLPIAREGRLVWLRAPDTTSLTPATFGTDQDERGLSVHYEVPVERGYESVGRGSGRLRLTGLENERLEGRMTACFADASSSCVRGAFHAYPCYSRIDGRALREAPGLSDDALEPPRAERTAEQAEHEP